MSNKTSGFGNRKGSRRISGSILVCFLLAFAFLGPALFSSPFPFLEPLYAGNGTDGDQPNAPTPPDADGFQNPHDRAKHGPPLTNVLQKVNARWLFNWLKDPQGYDPTAKMPNLKLSEDEIEAVIAYLASIADARLPQLAWEPFLNKREDQMNEEELRKLDSLTAKGKLVWSQARCTICHAVKGRGGFVNLHVGVDLGKVSSKVNRSWLYQWIKDPKQYFPETLMPRFRFTDEEGRALVEYLLRDPAFLPDEDQAGAEAKEFTVANRRNDSARAEKGKRIIELSRCILCHDIRGIQDLLPPPRAVTEKQQPVEPFGKLLHDVRCLTCHRIRGVGGDYAPDLSHEGSRLKAEWIVDFLKAPDTIRPLLQQMPKFNLSHEEATIAARYIKEKLVHPEIPGNFSGYETPGAKPRAGRLEGGQLFLKMGCQACHTIGLKGGAIGPNLTLVGKRLEPAYIFSHLKGRHRANPYAPEPLYDLSDEETMGLTRFLMSRTR